MSLNKMRTLRLLRKKSVRILAAITLVLLLFCVIQMVRPKIIRSFQGDYEFQEGVPVEDVVVYTGISLRPGVYYVEMEYEASGGGLEPMGYASLRDGTVLTGALKTNVEHFYEGLEKTGYHMWLYESTDDLQMTASYEGRGNLRITGYTVTETNQLWTMLMTIILFVSCLSFCVIAYYYYDREYGVETSKKHAFFFLALISFSASLPFLCGGNMVGMDLIYHLMRIEGVKDGFLSGQIPLRIEPEWLYGQGYPVGIFYCNILLYFPAILRLLGFTVSMAYNVYCIALNVATAYIAYYCFKKIFKSVNVGLVCSALYTLSIFRIYKLMYLCATGEGSAVTFMPLVLYGLYRAFTEDPKSKAYKTVWIPIAIGYAGLIQTHVLTCEITAFLTLLICLLCIRKVFSGNTFLELAKGAISAVLLSLWFLVPFLDFYFTQDIHVKHMSSRTIQSTGMRLSHLAFHFWRRGIDTPNSSNGLYRNYPAGVGMVLVLGLALFFILWFCGAFRKVSREISLLAKISAILGSLLLFMSTNVFPWDRIRALNSLAEALVSTLEITHRVLGWGTLFLVTVCGFCLWYFKQSDRWHYLLTVGVTVVCIMTSGVYLINYIVADGGRFFLYNEEAMGFGFISDAEYLIEGTDPYQLTFVGDALAGDGVTVSSYEKKYQRVNLQCVNLGGGESYVDVPMMLYKGYKAWDEEGNLLAVCAGENNMIRVMLPEGFAGGVEINFVSPFYWRISELVSCVTLLVFLVMWQRKRRRAVVCSERK